MALFLAGGLLAASAAAYGPAARLGARGAAGRAHVRLASSDGGLDASALSELESWGDDDEGGASRVTHDDWMASLKTGGTPVEERLDAPPPGYVPFAERADEVMGTAGAEETDGDAFEKYMATLRRPQSVDPDHPVTLRGDQAHEAWLAALKTGGTPAEERDLTPPPGYTPALERMAKSLGVSPDFVNERAAESDPFDAWMETLRTGGTPDAQRDLTVPEGHVPFELGASASSADGYAERQSAAKEEVLKRVAQARQQVAQQRKAAQAQPAQQAFKPTPKPQPAAAAKAPPPPSAANDVLPAPTAVARAPLSALSMSLGAEEPAEAAAVAQATRGLLAWLAQPADSRQGEAGAAYARAPLLAARAPPTR